MYIQIATLPPICLNNQAVNTEYTKQTLHNNETMIIEAANLEKLDLVINMKQIRAILNKTNAN
jgi:hypothetical protein